MKNRRLSINDNPLFGKLPLELADNLHSLNPWWVQKPSKQVPPFHRWAFPKLKRLLTQGMTPATVLRGPRRVGKTVLMRQLIESLLTEGINPARILYVPFDELPTLLGLKEPVLDISRWYEKEILKHTFNEFAQKEGPSYLFLDEVQNLANWAPQIKNLVDNHDLRAVVTGSSSLRIESGRDSLAGRITTLDLGPLFLREIAGLRFGEDIKAFWAENTFERLSTEDFWFNAIEHGQKTKEIRLRSFKAFSDRGAYPMAHERADIPWEELADNLNETVIKRAIQHDLRMGPRGQKRDEKLLEEVFRLCCRYTGQAPGPPAFVPEIQQALSANVGWNRILNYLRFLDRTMLIRLIQPLELRLKKRKSPPKICLCDHALRAGWLQEIVPLDIEGLQANPHLTDLAGHLAESVLGYFFASIPSLDIAHFPARGSEPEVDFILTVGTRRIPIEVKYRRRIDPHDDTRGLRAFLERTVYNAPFGLLVTLEDDVHVPDPRIVPISLSALLWMK
ncbi:MAG: ATP-binding protein [Deltaproteobacteria bacterium]|nr:ATP-binding protein [Deltaproteobacteria bacterium]